MINIKKVAISVAVGVAVAGGIWFASPSQAAGCDRYINVVDCGTKDHQTLKSVYNQRPEIKALYNHYGITDAMVNGTNMKTGTVYKDGRVVVDGRVVATGAKTLQRNTRYPGAADGKVSVAGNNYYQFSTQNSFVYNQFEVFAWFDNNGKFLAAIIKDCGNPLWGTPTPPPAKPVLTCGALTKMQESRNTFAFKTTANAQNGATISNYSYDFGDGTKQTAGDSVKHTYAKPGTYTITVTVNGVASAPLSATSQSCKTTVTVKPEPTIEVCRLSDKKYPVEIKEAEFNQKLHSKNPEDCKETPVVEKIKVCVISTKQITWINKSEYDESKHTTDQTKCEETPPTTPPAEVVPAELPRTGGQTLLTALSLGGLTAAGTAYLLSRRKA